MSSATKNFTGGGSSGGGAGAVTDAKIEELKVALNAIIASEGDETQVDLVALIAATGALQASNVLESDQSQTALALLDTSLQELILANHTDLDSVTAAQALSLISTDNTTVAIEGAAVQADTNADLLLAQNTIIASQFSAIDGELAQVTVNPITTTIVPAGARSIIIYNNGGEDLLVDGMPLLVGGTFIEECSPHNTLPAYNIVVPSNPTNPSFAVRTLRRVAGGFGL